MIPWWGLVIFVVVGMSVAYTAGHSAGKSELPAQPFGSVVVHVTMDDFDAEALDHGIRWSFNVPAYEARLRAMRERYSWALRQKTEGAS